MEATAASPKAASARRTDAHIRAHEPRAGARMSATPVERSRPAETIAGLLAAVAIFVGLTGIVYRPLRLIPLAILLALIALAIGGRHERLAGYAVATCAVCFVLGMAAAVVTSNPLW